jgi:hypothetical protein
MSRSAPKGAPVHRLLAVALLAAALATANVQLSAAAFTASSRSSGTIGAAADWTPPTVSLRDPGPVLRGTLTLTADASDGETGITQVRIELAPQGGGFTPICTATTAPYTCVLATSSYPDGTYSLRAVATDGAGYVTTSAVLSGRTIDNTGPTVEVTHPGDHLRGTVTIAASATDAGAGVASVRIQYALGGTSSWVDLCTGTAAPYECAFNTTTVKNDSYDLRAIATDLVGNLTTSAVVGDIGVDNTPPTVTMGDPGATLSGTVTLSATAADADSGVAKVEIQHAPAGTTVWSTACVRTGSPWSCRFDTTVLTDGLYDFRAIATDEAGNTTTSAAVRNRKVDNTVSAVSMEDPGAFLRGVEALTASASSSAGITSVRIQRAPSGTTSWTDVCTLTIAPFTCQWDTTTVANGLYSFRAVLLDGAGKTTTSTTVANRQVDNTPVRGFAVRGVNGGAIQGRFDSGDRLILTYNGEVNPASVMSGWTGEPQPVVVRMRDGGLVGGGSKDDTLDVFTSTTLATPVRVGSVNLRNDLLKKTATFHATMTRATVEVEGRPASEITVTLGQVISASDLRTVSSTNPMVWSPASVLDVDGVATSTSPVSGAAVRNF